MENLQKAKEYLDEQVRIYRQTAEDDGNGYCEVLTQITATLYYLEAHRAKYHNDFQSIVHALVLEGKSVNREENIAHVEVPEFYELKRKMDSEYDVVSGIKTKVSWIKTGLTNT